MILKILLVIGVIGTVYFFFLKSKPTKKMNEKKGSKAEANDMIECSTCSVYCEINESILSNGDYFCSSECVKKIN